MSQPAAPANLNIRVFTQSGSKADLWVGRLDVRFTTDTVAKVESCISPNFW